MSDLEMRGALFFSNEHPQITGYLVICGQHFEVAGWQPSPIRAEITARHIGEASKGRDAEQQGDDDDGSSDNPCGTGPRQYDPARS